VPSFIDLTGQQFNRWFTIERAADQGKQTAYLCRCSCGTLRVVAANNLKTGKSESCGCLAAERAAEAHTTHGMSRHPAYASWCKMISRCENVNDQKYHIYGKRGIKVCRRWRECFENFWEDMGATWQKGLTLDRIDPNGDYEPSNCRWATAKVQGNNKCYHRIVDTIHGPMNVSQAAELSGLDPETIRSRDDAKWPKEDLLSPPMEAATRERDSTGRFVCK